MALVLLFFSQEQANLTPPGLPRGMLARSTDLRSHTFGWVVRDALVCRGRPLRVRQSVTLKQAHRSCTVSSNCPSTGFFRAVPQFPRIPRNMPYAYGAGVSSDVNPNHEGTGWVCTLARVFPWAQQDSNLHLSE